MSVAGHEGKEKGEGEGRAWGGKSNGGDCAVGTTIARAFVGYCCSLGLDMVSTWSTSGLQVVYEWSTG
eukprot:8632803-Prorocentrum_lima.AAC.1